ncbi:MAG: SMC family ATPase [Candidatus Methanoperedens sp.]|nr:SMC family ATPase [Candidatus Methanoperedens sp.]
MIIKSLELKNVKSYKHETIEFKEGINGICGQNGHGKTTILEAIGYALFDYIPYNAGEFLRHGEKSGMVSVTVEGNDEIDYIIYRKIGGSEYFIKTPVSEIRGKKDVTDWIAKNLLYGIGSPEDLSSMFENAVGVPQGTFTTAFLLNPGPRKKVFDTILRVEDYQIAYSNLRAVINSIEKRIESLDRDLLPLHTRIEKYQELKQEKESLEVEIGALKKEIEENKVKITELKLKKEDLSGKKSRIDILSNQIANDQVRLAERNRQLEKAGSELQLAQNARKIVAELLPVEESFKKKNLVLKGLNDDRIKRDLLKEELSKLDFKISSLIEKLDRSFKITQENNVLEEKKQELLPAIEAAQKLEESIKELQKELKEPMVAILSDIANLREKQNRMEEIRTEIEKHNIKKAGLLPLKEKQLELGSRIKDLKEELETPLRALSSEVASLKDKQLRAENLKKEIAALISKKNQLIPEMQKHKDLDEEIGILSLFFDSLTKIDFDLRRAAEKDAVANALSTEIDELEKRSKTLEPLIEQQVSLEAKHLELSHQQAACFSLLKQIKNNMKLAGTQGICPLLNGIKCRSVSDFSRYFNDEIDLKKKEIKKIEEQSRVVLNDLNQLNSPKKQAEDILVLISSKKKELNIYKNAHNEFIECRKSLKSLGSSYSTLGLGELSGSEEESKTVYQRLQARKKEFERTKRSASESESIDALVGSKNKDLENFYDLKYAFSECNRKVLELNSRFNLNIEIENIDDHLENTIKKIKCLERTFKDLNDPESQINTIESLINSKNSDLESLKVVPERISECMEKLQAINERFRLKERLAGNPEEIRIADELIEKQNKELKALNSPDKEYEKLKVIIEKNLKELKTLEHSPSLLDSSRSEREKLSSRYLVFDGIDEKISSANKQIEKLEPEHNKYLQQMPLSLKLNEYAQECLKIEESIGAMNASLSENIQKRDEILLQFSEQKMNEIISRIEELGKTTSGMAEAVRGKRKNLERLSRDITLMDSDIQKIKEIQRNLENEKEFLSFSNFIRETIKNSSEFIVNEFIGEISHEASNIFSEIMDDHSSGLKWANDYDIEIDSSGETKSFRQLSGGERMSAALSVRLALLKALSNCDFVFLDEPTQNMDEIRREKLSEEITKIHGFKQVFVISHDDTFNEKYEYVIKIEKIDGESRAGPCLT